MDGIRGLTRVWRAQGPGDQCIGLVERVLEARGVSGADAAEFLEPSLAQLHDPSLIPDLDRAAERLLTAADSGEPIAIYGDYDVDGVTATCILYRMLRAIRPEADLTTYIPHRVEEGYGLNAESVRTLASNGARVIVSVDCGITAFEPALAARESGADLIITDHHNPSPDGLPDAFAVVHPSRDGSAYPFADLCGAGVAYKLAWRLATLECGDRKVRPDLRELLVELLAPCALGVIADVVPLVGENRVIARFGLPRVRTSPFVGLAALVESSGLGAERISAEDVGFRLAPRINAIGRLGHAAEAVELLLTDDARRAGEIAQKLSALNDERRTIERAIFNRACELAEGAGMTGPDRRAIVLAEPGWHPGVVGIVCSRLVERYARPALLLAPKDGVLAGSGRSLDGFNLHAALADCDEHLMTYGGHDMAAGLRVAEERFDAFVEAFVGRVGAELGPDDLVRPLGYDCDAGLGELTPDAVRALGTLAPFGRSNPSVRIRVVGASVLGRPEAFGKTGNHLKIRLGGAAGGPPVTAIAWGWASRLESIPNGASVDAVLTPKLNEWRGNVRIEPELHDLRIENAEPAFAGPAS